MAERLHHADKTSASLHILLTAAMERLGITTLTVTEQEYKRATKGYSDLRLRFDGLAYRAERILLTEPSDSRTIDGTVDDEQAAREAAEDRVDVEMKDDR